MRLMTSKEVKEAIRKGDEINAGQQVSVVKNRSTPQGAEFWDHVDSIAAQERRQQVNEKAPIPEDLRVEYEDLKKMAKGETYGAAVAGTQVEYIERIAALQAEVDALKRERDLLRMNHPFGPMYDALRKAQDENTALKDEVARLSAPVTDAEWDSIWHSNARDFADKLILARATPPQDVENGGKG